MKLKRASYFSIGFLFLFLCSFSTNVYMSISDSSIIDLHFLAKKNVTKNTPLRATENLEFEETENDCEEGFKLQCVEIPFIVSYVQLKLSKLQPVSEQPLSEKLTNPIYIAVGNFRI